MIDTQVVDLVEQTRRNLARHAPTGLDEVRFCPPLVAFGEALREEHLALKRIFDIEELG